MKTIEVSSYKVNMKITEIVNELIEILNRPSNGDIEESILNVFEYTFVLEKLQVICDIFDIDMDRIMRKAGLVDNDLSNMSESEKKEKFFNDLKKLVEIQSN
jgi:hypothetical protein